MKPEDLLPPDMGEVLRIARDYEKAFPDMRNFLDEAMKYHEQAKERQESDRKR